MSGKSGYGTPPGTEATPLELDRLTALEAKPTYMEAKVSAGEVPSITAPRN